MQINSKLSIPQVLKSMEILDEVIPPKDIINSYRTAITRIHNDAKSKLQFTSRNNTIIRLKDKS